jgi:hypothetical protein
MTNESDTKKSGRNVIVCAAAMAAAMTMGWCAAMATVDRAEKGAVAAQPPSATAPTPVPVPVVENVAPVATNPVAVVETPPPEVTRAPPIQEPMRAPPPKRPRAPKPVVATQRAPLPQLPRPLCTDERGCDTTDLQRCLAHDGDGCASVGAYYELERADPFSAIAWYRKGCDLSSNSACRALDRVKDARPREGARREDPLAASMPVIGPEMSKPALRL